MKIGAAAAASGGHIGRSATTTHRLAAHPARNISGYREYLPEEVERHAIITRGRGSASA
jgi:hypothetical protein